MASTVMWGLPESAQAVDGVVLIDQNRALAGNVTPGDNPGFPVTITRAGSYRLSGNLTVPNENTVAVNITADNVTLDLNGFSILGPAVCSGSGSSLVTPTTCTPSGGGKGVTDIFAPGGLGVDGTAVTNGTVSGMGSLGVQLNGKAHIENVHAVSNGGGGIQVSGSGMVTGSTAERNGGSGILVGFGTVSGCTAKDNGAVGIGGDFITVTGNTVSRNSHGLQVGSNSLVIGNVVTENLVGLQLGSGSGYTHNVLSGNSFATVSGGTSLGQNLCDGVIC